ncbi:MAG: DegV family protein, partial [Oscillospiraceae bacterium]
MQGLQHGASPHRPIALLACAGPIPHTKGGKMEYKIITDSCCDLTPELKKEMGITTVPLTMRLGDKEFL